MRHLQLVSLDVNGPERVNGHVHGFTESQGPMNYMNRINWWY